MEYRKRDPDKKRFWLGMAGCALVSFTAYAVSYFSSSHIFSNEYNANKNYSVEIYDVIDTNNSMSLWQNKENHINSDLVIKNTGKIPVLLRIKYARYSKQYGFSYWTPDSNDKNKSWCHHLSHMSDYYKMSAQNENKFLFNGETTRVDDTNSDYDGYYYYKGVLQPNQLTQHLDEICTVKSESTRLETFYYSGLDSNTYQGWKYGPGNNLGLGKMLWRGNAFAYVSYSGKGQKSQLRSIRANVETIQAPIKDDGSYLSDDDVKDLDSLGLKKYWKDALGDN